MMTKISRSEQKRQYKQIEAAVREFVSLNDAQLKRSPVSEEMIPEVKMCRSVKGGALKRQIKYVTKMMQLEPLDEIFTFLRQEKGSKLEDNRFQHQAEKLRDSIVTEALQAYHDSLQFEEPWSIDWQSQAIDQVVELFPTIDEMELRSSAHQYVRSRKKSILREISRIIRAAADKKRLALR
jgi:ribosome-associated protein